MSKGAAILAVGHGPPTATARLTSLVAQIGETLLANEGGWRVRRLSPLAGEREGADRASWKRCLSELCDDTVDRSCSRSPGARHDPRRRAVPRHRSRRRRAIPTSAHLPLEWIRDRLRTCRADRVVVVASLEGRRRRRLARRARDRARAPRDRDRARRSCARAPRAARRHARRPRSIPKTGTITLRSLGDHLAQDASKHARLQVSDESETLASSPPLAGPWDARLTSRPACARSTVEQKTLRRHRAAGPVPDRERARARQLRQRLPRAPALGRSRCRGQGAARCGRARLGDRPVVRAGDPERRPIRSSEHRPDLSGRHHRAAARCSTRWSCSRVATSSKSIEADGIDREAARDRARAPARVRARRRARGRARPRRRQAGERDRRAAEERPRRAARARRLRARAPARERDR